MTSAEFLKALNRTVGQKKALTLAELGYYLGQSARSAYPVAGETSTSTPFNRLRSLNEMHIIVSDELMKALRQEDGRSNADFLESLSHWARLGDCTSDLNWALSKALDL
jgi:hypothetical protein